MLFIVLFLIVVTAYLTLIFIAGKHVARVEKRRKLEETLREASRTPPTILVTPTENVDSQVGAEPLTSPIALIPVFMIGEEMYQQPTSDADHFAWIAESQGLAGHDGPVEPGNTDIDDATKKWIDESGGHAGYDAPF